jgi:AcrR family transcriptional regulator
MPNARFHKLTPEKQAHILDTAAKAFAQHGVEGASINQILVEAGMSKGAAYYYFENKADLFDTAARHCWDAFVRHVDFSLKGVTAKTFWPRVCEIQQHAAAHMAEDPVITTVAKSLWRKDSQLSDTGAIAEIVEWTRGWIREMVTKGQQLGLIRKDLPLDLIVGIVAAADQAVDYYLAHNGKGHGLEQILAINAKVCEGLHVFLSPPRKRKP